MSSEFKKGALGFRQDTPGERFFNGLIAENPTLVLMIGMWDLPQPSFWHLVMRLFRLFERLFLQR